MVLDLLFVLSFTKLVVGGGDESDRKIYWDIENLISRVWDWEGGGSYYIMYIYT